MRWAAAIFLCAAAAWARPNTAGSSDLFHYAAGETVESFDAAGGHFRIWFTRAGTDAVPSTDADTNNVPDFVEQVADLYEQVLTFYQGLGFRTPPSDANLSGDNGGDGRFDVYLIDFAGKSDGSFQRDSCDQNVCIGYSVHENDFAGYGYPSLSYGNRVLASHEFFHAVQAAYDGSEDTIVSEGTAVWATEQFDNTLHDFEDFVPGYLTRPDHSLYVPLTGPVDDFSYGSCLFFEFLSEKYGTSVIKELWEQAAGSNDWFGVLDGVLQQHQSSFAEGFATFSRWNLFTQKRANPALGYARATGYGLVKMEADTAPLSVASLRVFPSAIAYLAIPPDGRAQMDVALFNGDPALQLALAVRRANVVSEPVLADATLRASVATDGADELLVVIANTAQSGESHKPAVCAGDSSEVDACLRELAPPMTSTPSGGCSVSPASANSWWLVSLVLLLLLGRRRLLQ